MLANRPRRLLLIVIFLVFFGLEFILLAEGETNISINGVVCNRSSICVWLTLSQGET